MIEILFRGKTKQGNWVEGNGIMQGQDCISYARWVDICDDSTRYEVIPETVGRFTGLTDKNGKKIFEGDIVKGCWNTVFVVYFDDCYLQYRARAKGEPEKEIDYYGNSSKLEVIGNIHDNPELLEKYE